MSNTDKSGLVPNLRFPEFLTAEGWQVAPLSQLATRTKKKNRDQTITRVLTNSAEFGVVDQRDFFDKDIATQGNLESYFVVDLGSYVYNPRISATAPVGPISKNKVGTGVMSPLYTVFKFENDSNEFYEHYFKTTGWHTYMRQASSTGARHDRMAISSDDFMAMPLPVSSPAEQQKIANCLSSLDELIAAQARKVDALKTHKKGLMQQLFPREGETQPRLRFPEFNNSGSWTERLLGGCLEEYREKSTKQDEYEVMTSARSGLVRQRDYYDNDRITERDNIGFNVLPPSYITYRSRSDDRQFYFNENNLGITGIVSVYYPVFRIINGSNRYFIELLSAFSRVVGKYSVGTSQTVLSLNQLGKIRLPFPPTVEEQQSIADCLTSVETLITAATQELETLKTHKKGLMQQLFPSPEALEA
ncbi:restriction endonuclease subunit S [Acidovorax sp. BLS4]|uniref:restriction endonuclease subunit S n=1 Tax=Acidovorax sp. BLS4 TaxID=3273430 RepID=UPI0029431377|nr:restriction endonuclease subunit S [Paracidovorax avenae]WOI46940.1 restriction endonuclease subunit S [Paracidovorax avenae]